MKKSLIILLSLSLFTFSNAQTTVNLNATQNTYIETFGGGMGKNTFLKFDISSIPANAVITDVRFNGYVFYQQAGWDGDMRFIRFNRQNWVETDSSQLTWNTALFTDTVIQLMGFGMVNGFSQSPDLTSLFMADFVPANTFFSIVMKDMDDVTCCPSSVPSLTNTDSLLSGNIFNDKMAFRPRLYANPNQRPYLSVTYGIPPTTGLTIGTSPVCIGDSTMLDGSIIGGDGPLSFQWQFEGVDIPGATDSSYWINPIASSDSGNYTLIVTNVFGADTSIQILIDVDTCFAGIDESGSINLFKITPNPHNGNFNVVVNAISQPATIDIVNNLGEVIYTVKVTSNTFQQNVPINISEEPNGIYFVRLYNTERNHIEKTIKN